MQKRNKSIQIGIDLMGHDNAPEVLIKTLQQLSLPEHVRLLAIGLPEYAHLASPLAYHSALEVIEMNDAPLAAVRKKKGSSLCAGLRLLKEKQIDAFVSAGNTGALVSASKMILGMKKNFSRPALLTLLPTKKNLLAVVDVGANVEAKASQLIQFAFMGAAYQQIRGIELPAVGLLNIGSESMKGTSELRLAYERLSTLSSSLPFRFVGNVEGNLAFEGDIDVLVTDGFTGNIFLKTSEGIANLLLDKLFIHIPKEILAPHLATLKRQLHYDEYPGALLAGVEGTVIKCHGYSSPKSFASAIHGAIEACRQ